MQHDFIECKAQIEVSDAGELTGIAWPFGSADRVGDMIEKGAFNNTPERLPMLFAHDHNQVVGVWDSVTETAFGLQVKGRLLIDDVQRSREVRAMIKTGAVSGLSIGFQTKKAMPRKGGGRKISKLDLVEVSIVAVPAHPGARITSAKSANRTKGESMENDTNEIENKGADVAAIEAKVSGLEDSLKGFEGVAGRLDKIEARLNRPSAPYVAKDADADIEKKAFESFARHGLERMNPTEAKSLSVSVNTAGGYLVPPNWLAELQKNLVQFSPMRSVARVTTTGAPVVTLPKRTQNLSAYWVGETEARTETAPVYGSQSIAMHELACFVDVSNQLLEDSMFNLEQELMRDFAEEFGRAEGDAFLNGTGANVPAGLIKNTDVSAVEKGLTITADDLIDLFHNLPAPYAQNASWIMNRQTIGLIRKMKTTTGEYLWHDNVGAEASLPFGNAPSILGRPVIEMPDMPNVADGAIPIAFGDFNTGFRIFDRVSLAMIRDPYTVATTGQVRFHARRRVGGGVVKPESMRFLKTID